MALMAAAFNLSCRSFVSLSVSPSGVRSGVPYVTGPNHVSTYNTTRFCSSRRIEPANARVTIRAMCAPLFGAPLEESVKKTIGENPVVVYSKSWCSYSTKVKSLLKKLGVDPHIIELDQGSQGPQLEKSLEKLTGQHTVPNVFIGGKHIGGCTDALELHKKGELQSLLSEAGAKKLENATEEKEQTEKDSLTEGDLEEDDFLKALFPKSEVEEENFDDDPYNRRIDSYQTNTGLTEAVQTGVGELDGIPIAIGVMDFRFLGGSMGSAVGEKITRLIEYAMNAYLPLVIVCASGGARMQEGSLSLMQMAKISSALHDYQSTKKLLYVPILTSPTTGGVTASFGMLGDIIIAEPEAYIAFAGKRVIEQTLNIKVPDGSQEAEPLFEKGLFDRILPRYFLKAFLRRVFSAHGFYAV